MAVYLRLVRDSRGQLQVRELFVDGSESGPITPAVLSDVPLREIQVLLNAQDAQFQDVFDVELGLAAPVGGPATGSTLSVLASHFRTRFGSAASKNNWCAVAQTSLENGDPIAKRKTGPAKDRPVDYVLPAPPGADGLSDEFLGRVARAHAAAVARGEAPNQAIAKQIATSHHTVARWVQEARRRGVMPKASAKGSKY
ncbi:hypothetical protein [uncultured Jatrophihabitans sp.]|uniref:hypothetical protein n=1 Tax=uncultured Jatrophihabitans sp. TaxID=1610747 RepID=UPI0035CC5E07